MKFATVLTLACFIAAAWAVKEDEKIGRRIDVGKDVHVEHRGSERQHGVSGEERRRPFEEKHRGREEELGSKKSEHQQGFKMDERTKEVLLKEKSEKPHVFVDTMIDYVLSNENRKIESQCFEKFKPEDSVDFVIDIAPSPNQDKWDKLSAESPLAYFLDIRREAPSQSYFTAIQMFIDAITYSMKPELTHSIIVDHGNKYFIRGKPVKEEKSVGESFGDFSDKDRNLKTMWPVPTKEVVSSLGEVQTKKVERLIKNNLGRMTKLALWNRDNGLPTVLGASRRSKPVYTFVITDGASGTRLTDLTEDLSRTTVIDIGNRRFAKTLEWEEMRRLVNVVTLNAPQALATMIDTCLFLVCKSYGCC